MKSSVPTLILVAVASSLATVESLELLRGSPQGVQPASSGDAQVESAGDTAPRAVEPLVPARMAETAAIAADSAVDPGARLDELERRVSALELDLDSPRTPVTSAAAEPPPQSDLRELVLEWVAEEREVRSRAEELEQEEQRLKEVEFGARHDALMFAQEHGLAQWQQDRFAELFLETARRADELEADMDIGRDNPEELEARWAEFDEWVDRRERELTAEVDPDLYEKLYGEDE